MKKRMVSLLLALAMVMGLAVPAWAEEGTQNFDLEQIRELAILAGEAARSGNSILAEQYEDQLHTLGGQVLTSSEILQLEGEFMGIVPYVSSVELPPNTHDIHWTLTPKKQHSYKGKSYDIIAVTAVSWDDTNEWLHADFAASYAPRTPQNIAVNTAYKFIQLGLTKTAFSAFVTLGNFFDDIGKSASNYSLITTAKSGIAVSCSEDINITFYWISEAGANDYSMRVKETSGEVNYGYTANVSLTNKSTGKVDTINQSGTVRQKSYKAANYGNLDRVCQAYLNGTVAEYAAEDITITINDVTFQFPQPPLPQGMGTLTNYN